MADRGDADTTTVVDPSSDRADADTLVTVGGDEDDRFETPPSVELPDRSAGHRSLRRHRDPDRAPREPIFEPARQPGHRVTRVVRRVQLWSVFKVAVFGTIIFYAIFLLAVALGWALANSTGQVHHIEKFMRDIGFDNWSFDGPQLFRVAALVGAVGVVAGSVLITLSAAIINLISELTGGIRFTVLEVDDDLDAA